jgi:hypothetical protein
MHGVFTGQRHSGHAARGCFDTASVGLIMMRPLLLVVAATFRTVAGYAAANLSSWKGAPPWHWQWCVGVL